MAHDLRITARAEKKAELSPSKIENKFTIQGGSKLEVFDEDGRKLYEGEFKSFTANFLKLLYGSMVGAGTAKAKDLTNTDLAMDSFPQSTFNIAGGAGVKKFGVVVGTNTAAVSVSDYNITVPAGLTVNDTAVGASSVGADSISVEISRQIGNSSGSTVNLKEAGLICGMEDGADTNVLIARDLLDLTLENGKKSVWHYTINFNFANDVGGFVKAFADTMFNGIFKQLTSATDLGKISNFGCVVYDGKMWVMGGSGPRNNVWNSIDGITWIQVNAAAPWIARQAFGCVVYDGKMWVMGGLHSGSYLNDVWNSTDGITWIQVTASAGWSARYDFGCVVYDGKMWVMGGSGPRNDVWNSIDGITWIQVTASAGWSARYNFGCVVYDGKMWVMGGSGSGGKLNDVWNSPDGTTWARVTSAAGWSGRENFGCVVYDGKMWVMGGYGSTSVKDVWGSFLNAILLLGSSDSAFSATATALGALIQDGTGSGELIYGAMPGAATTEPIVSGNRTKMSIAREFTNNSGADIIVKEVGLFSGTDMLARLIFANPVTIANGQSDVITVDFETEV